MAIVIVSEKGGLSAVSLNPRLFKPAISAYVREPDLFIYLLFLIAWSTRHEGEELR